MSLLVTSDLHAHTWPRFATTLPTGVNSRFQNLLDVLAQIEDIAGEYEPDALLVLGDLTHQRYFMRFSVYTPLMAWLLNMNKRMKTYVLKGNHDEEAEGVHSLGPLALAGIRVIDRPAFVDLPGLGSSFMVPYMEGERVATVMREANRVGTSSPRHAFLHYALDGKVMTGGEYEVPSALKLSDCDAFDKLVFGHVHGPAVEQDGRIVYVGAPLHMDFGDVGDRYCWFFPDGGQAPRAIKLDAPKFITTNYPRIAAAPLEHSGFLRVLNTPSALFDDVKREAIEQGWLDCLPIEERMPEEAVRTLSASMLADETAIRSYIERQYPDLSPAEREHMITFGLDCLREAQR